MTPPEVGSKWKHPNGIKYTVVHIANIGHLNSKYPPCVVYQGSNGNVWVKTIPRFYKSMIKL